jgi:dGTPase
MTLAPYASKSARVRADLRDEPMNFDHFSGSGSDSTARPLKTSYKTQVFLISEGDFYRTRLTHTLEVAQHARTLARALKLNEDLCEAIAYAHDMGHTPFGHTGEETLNESMKQEGGFEHNLQSLRTSIFSKTVSGL